MLIHSRIAIPLRLCHMNMNNKLTNKIHKVTPLLINNTQNRHFSALIKNVNNNFQQNSTQYRQFSLQSSIEAIARTQSGLFKSLSECAPVECIQGLLLNVHDYTGLPWWATIICTSIFLRTIVTVPLAVYQQYILAKLEIISMEMPEIVKQLKKETAAAIRMYKWDERTTKIHYKRSLKKQWNNLIIRENCHPIKASLLIWFQIPMWICFSASLRNLVYELPKMDLDAKLTLAELTVGGFGWIPNLAEVDSSMILPVSLGILNLAIIEIQSLSKVNVPSKFQKYMTNFFKGFSILLIPIAASVPSCLTLYWTASSAFGLAQNLVLMSPTVKRFCRIPNTPSQLENPYFHVVQGFKHKYSFLNK